ncbi:TIGR04141 family sporadically distributed protein, partial [Salinactinospora qingdaonensis]|uniref:TIGR04141 family sporadically distributed protein n=1 Tax=Salinactinospora qingdaonensis TaxID=702744 RepID=UPI0031F0A9D2
VREVTLYRLTGVEADERSMCAVFDEAGTARQQLDLRATRIATMPAVVLYGMRGGERPPDWQADAVRTTAIDLDLRATSPVVAVLVAVDNVVYAFGYGGGHHFIPRDLRDPEFGRTFAACALDPATVATVNTRDMDTVNRYGSIHVPRGQEVRTFGLRHERELVNRLKARCGLNELTAARGGEKARFVECGDGIRTHLGVDQVDLVNDIRFIAATVEERYVQEEMRFLEDRKEVRSPEKIEVLWSLVEDGLREPESIGLAISPPLDVFDQLNETRSFQVRIGPVSCPLRSEFREEDLSARLRHLKKGTLAQALKNGWIRLFEDANGQREIAEHRNLCYWIEATVAPGSEMYVLRDGRWYEYGPRYLEEVRRETADLLAKGSSVDLPEWPDWLAYRYDRESPEAAYNRHVAETQPGYLCLDKNLAHTDVHSGNGIELCDLLGPGNELVHVKQASSAAGLSHLFNQAKSAVESLHYEKQAHEWFANTVASMAPERDLSGFQPRTVVFGIRLAKHSDVTVDNLYPLAQVELYRTAVALRRCGITVEVVAIRHNG